MNYKIILLAVSIVLSGCSAHSILIEQDSAYNPKQDARIRVYQINGNRTTVVLPETSCRDSDNKISKNPFRRHNRHGGMPQRTLRNTSIGMPLTERSAKALARDSYFQVDSFTEQQVRAGKPVVVRGSQFDAYSCQIRAEFIPEAGKDYEVSFLKAERRGAYCSLMIHELVPFNDGANNRIKAKTGKEIRYQKCF